jgi:hypothetical protein
MVRLSLCIVVQALALAAPHPNKEPHYVGSKVCFGCHANIYRTFTKTDMGRSMRLADDLNERDIPIQTTVPIASGTREISVFHDGAGWHQRESESNVFVDEHKLDYVVGSGANGLSFIVRRGNHLFQAPLSFYSKVGRWGLSPGYEYADYGFSRPIDQECVLCHSGRPQPVEHRRGEYLDPPFRELAIGCENCHGPGEFHAREPNRGKWIVNPAKLPPRLAENICMNCHQGGDARVLQPGKSYGDFRPGEWLIDTIALFKIPPKSGEKSDVDLLEHNSAMKISRCFRESAGRLSCLTCHDPHVQPAGAEAVSYYRQKCFTCHTDQSCRLPLTARIEHNPSDDCAGCHMPKRDIGVISHSALTNHRIPARPGQPLPKETADGPDMLLLNPRPGSAATIPDVTLLKAYSQLASTRPEYQQRYLALLERLSRAQPENPFVQAALGHKALAEGKDADALTHLSIGLSLGDAAVYQDMAKACSNLGRGEEALTYLKKAVEIEPYNQALLKTLTLQYISMKRYPEAREAMMRYVELFPEDSFMRKLLARVTN